MSSTNLVISAAVVGSSSVSLPMHKPISLLRVYGFVTLCSALVTKKPIRLLQVNKRPQNAIYGYKTTKGLLRVYGFVAFCRHTAAFLVTKKPIRLLQVNKRPQNAIYGYITTKAFLGFRVRVRVRVRVRG